MKTVGDGLNKPEKLVGFKGTKHKMHRRNGSEVEYDDKGEEVKSEGGFHDLGSKPSQVSEGPSSKVYYPSVNIKSGDIPGITDAKVGSEITMTVKARVVEVSQRDDESSVSLELRQAAIEGE